MNTVTCSPTSFQLRLAFNPRRFPLNLRVQKLGRRIRVFWVSGDNEQKVEGDSWADSSASADTFSGWSGNDGEDESAESKQEQKSWPGGEIIYSIPFYGFVWFQLLRRGKKLALSTYESICVCSFFRQKMTA